MLMAQSGHRLIRGLLVLLHELGVDVELDGGQFRHVYIFFNVFGCLHFLHAGKYTLYSTHFLAQEILTRGRFSFDIRLFQY